MRKWGLVLSVLLFTMPAVASDIYVGPAASGAANGADCADAYPYTWFSSSGNWGTAAGKIGPGTTVHVCAGTYSIAANGTAFSFQGSGTTSSPITLLFESGAVLQSPYFSSPYGGISAAGLSNIIIDGGSNGQLRNTLDGSPGATCPGGACAYQQSTTGIQIYSCTNCTVRNLTIANVYVHTQCDASSGCDTALTDFNYAKAINYSGVGFKAYGNVIHDAGCAFCESYQGPTDTSEFYDNDVYNIDHGWFGGAPSGATNFTISIHDNHIHDQAMWDTGAQDLYHHDGIHLYSGGNNTITSFYLYNNLFDGNEGQCCITSWVYIQSSVANAYVYNNIFVQTISVPNGAVSFDPGNVTVYPGSYRFYNNTFLSTAGAGNTAPAIFSSGATPSDGLSVTIQNNAFSGFNSFISLGSSVVSLTAANNVYANESGGGNNYWHWNTAGSTSLSTWQSQCGCDTGAVANLSGSLGVTSEGVPQSGSMVLGAGLNLTSLATALNPLSSDTSAGDTRTPVPRSALGSWDAGAYQSSLLLANAPQAPTNLSATVE